MESDVHFPTDLNLLLDGGRKCVDLVKKYREKLGYNLPGWRKLEDWQGRLKAWERVASKAASTGGGKDKEKRVRDAVESRDISSEASGGVQNPRGGRASAAGGAACRSSAPQNPAGQDQPAV